MPEELQLSCRYQILRYVPNLLRDGWVNVGVLLEEVPEGNAADAPPRREIRVIEEDAEIARVRRLHPGVDENLLRSLPGEFEARLRAPSAQVATYLEKLDQTLSTTLRLGPRRGVFTDDFDSELERLFRDQVSVPRTSRGRGREHRAVDSQSNRRRVPPEASPRPAAEKDSRGRICGTWRSAEDRLRLPIQRYEGLHPYCAVEERWHAVQSICLYR